MRVLVLIVLVYLGYRVLKSLIMPGAATRRPHDTGAAGMVDDVMVKDPLCETYFPKRDGVKAVINGETLYFCSEKCRDEYLDRTKQAS